MKYTYEMDKLPRKKLLFIQFVKVIWIFSKKRYFNIDKNKNSFDINRYNKDKFDLKETDCFVLSINAEQMFKENIKLFNICGKKIMRLYY